MDMTSQRLILTFAPMIEEVVDRAEQKQYIEIKRCLLEQRKARALIERDGANAILLIYLNDWIAEEVLIRLENNDPTSDH